MTDVSGEQWSECICTCLFLVYECVVCVALRYLTAIHGWEPAVCVSACLCDGVCVFTFVSCACCHAIVYFQNDHWHDKTFVFTVIMNYKKWTSSVCI